MSTMCHRSVGAAKAHHWINSLTVMMLSIALIAAVYGAPAQLDSNETPFPLELQPPLVDDESNGAGTAIDSYGNPIDTLKPIDTPDGRKVVSAQGIQFEIPTYASGITELRKPADDLLPPHIDPIAVAIPNAAETTAAAQSIAAAHTTNTQFALPTTTTTTSFSSSLTPDDTEAANVEIEQANLVKLNQPSQTQPEQQPQSQSQQQQEASDHAPQVLPATDRLPDYILEFNDPDIGGPVAWTPPPDGEGLKVIAWDLLPPHKDPEEEEETAAAPLAKPNQTPASVPVPVPEPVSVTVEEKERQGDSTDTHNVHVPVVTSSRNSGQQPADDSTTSDDLDDGPRQHGTNAHVGSTTPSTRFPNRNHSRGSVHYSTSPTTTRSTTTSRRSTTTTTPATTTTTTTTHRPTTTITTTTTQRPSTTLAPLDSAYKLANEEAYAYTLPPWLAGVTDPDLDVAVTFMVPIDNDQYNHTIERDLEPPLEPFVDLSNIHLTPPPSTEQHAAKIPTTATTTTARPITSTSIKTPTTTTTTATSTTTHRPTVSTTRAYWVRANPTSTTSTSTPSTTTTSTTSTSTTTIATITSPTTVTAIRPDAIQTRFNSNNFAPNHLQPQPQLQQQQQQQQNTQPSQNAIRAKPADASVSTSQAASQLQHGGQTSASQNSATSSTSPNTDRITSETENGAKPQPAFAKNPFLPKPFERNPPQTVNRGTATTTTTTTTTTAAPAEYKNPFDSATVPPWLVDFDYADIGPGVPYDPENFKDDDSQDASTNNKNPKPLSSFNPFRPTPSSQAIATTSSAPTASPSAITRPTFPASAFPSKVTLPLPSINNQASSELSNDDGPTRVLMPPADGVDPDGAVNSNYNNVNSNSVKHNAIATPPTSTHFQIPTATPSSSSNTNFAAHLEPQIDPTQAPLAISQETFPPFQANDVPTQKFEYTKSDEGKVITTPIQGQRKEPHANRVFGTTGVSPSGNTYTASSSQSSFAAGFGSTGTTTSSFAAASSVSSSSSSGNTKNPRPSISADGKFIGSFGGPDGLLKPRTQQQQQPSNAPNLYVAGESHDFISQQNKVLPTINSQNKYTGGFGAPSGILSPDRHGPRPFQSAQQPAAQQQHQQHQQHQQQSQFNNNNNAPHLTAAASNAGASFGTRFGGPPGILVPFDNVQGGHQ